MQILTTKRLSIPRSFLPLPASIQTAWKSSLLDPALVPAAADTERQVFLAQPYVSHASYDDDHTCSAPAVCMIR